ncbi:MAG: NAD(P)-dependent oxidoreductase [Acidobacteriota bacterium]|nr:NAD(P)-dependent oxidoreductase [Acidobacteriota bacterium]
MIDRGSKSVLLTGAGGFVGRHCIERLAGAGFEVHAVRSKKVEGGEGSGAVWHRADLLDRDAAKALVETVRPSHLLHLAWYGERDFYHSDHNFAWVEASFDLLRHFAANGGERVVMAGSSAEYDWSDGTCSEATTQLAPATLYGSCKRAMGLLFEAFVESAGLSGAWGRIFFIYGPGQREETLVGHVISSILKGERARCSSGVQLRDFLYVEDVADAMVALLHSDVAGPLNVGSGIPIRVRDLAVAAASGLQAADMIDFGAIEASDAASSVVADTVRLQRDVGWLPAFTLERGMERTIDWWRSRLELAAP